MRKLPGILVVLGLLFLYSGAIAYIHRFGARYPYSDDFDQVPYLVKNTLDWAWLWAPHVDHRILFPKLIHWISFRVTGDYRTPSFIVAAMFATLTILTAVISARIRGLVSVVDLVPALACFNFAQGFLNWGFYTTFGSSTFLLGLLIVWLASRIHGEQHDWKKWELVGLLVILLALSGSGTNGTVPALILSGYFAIRMAWRARNVNDSSTLASFLSAAGLAAVFLLSLTILLGIPQEGPFRAHHVRDAIEVALHVAVSPVGVVVTDTRRLIGTAVRWLSFALIVFAFFLAIKPVLHYANSFLSKQAKNRGMKASEWPTSKADFLAVALSIILLMLAIGVGRGGRGWEPGLEMHYNGVALPLIFWSYLSLVLSWRHRYVRLASGIFALIFVSSYWSSITLANWGGKFQTERRIAFERDLRAGKSLDEIINRNIAFLYWVDTPGTRSNVRNGLLLLKAEAIRDDNRRPALQPYLSITDVDH